MLSMVLIIALAALALGASLGSLLTWLVDRQTHSQITR